MDCAIGIQKRPQDENCSTDFTKCIICQKNVLDKEKSYMSVRGIPTMTEALNKRQDDVYKRLWSEIQDPSTLLQKKPFYHKACRSTYTHIKALQQVDAKKLETDIATETKVTRTSTKRVKKEYKSICFLCDRERDIRGVHKLILVATQQRQDTIYNRAKDLDDKELLQKIEGMDNKSVDMIALDFRYHKSCMTKYMNQKVQDCLNDTTSTDSKSKTNDHFLELVKEIEDPIFKFREAYYTTQLKDRYRTILRNKGIDNLEECSTYTLKHKLKVHFGSKIQFVPQAGKPTIVCSADITVSEMLSHVARLHRELEDSELMSESDDNSDENDSQNVSSKVCIHSVAKSVRRSMKNMSAICTKNDDPNIEISYEAAANEIPVDLYNLVAWLVTDRDAMLDESGKVQLEQRCHEKVLNISQDLMFSVTNRAMPKHIGLGLHILQQTRSKDLMTILNRYGHCISYHEAQRYLTSIANKIEEQSEQNGVFIPIDMRPNYFIQCAFDNLDFMEDTQDGKTFHGTTHNFYQYQNTIPNPSCSNSCSVPVKQRQRSLSKATSFTTSSSDVTIVDRRKARSIKQAISNVNLKANSHVLLTDFSIVTALLKRHILLQNEPTMSSVFTWNKFHEVLQVDTNRKTTISYGPMFPAAPTNPDVVKASIDYFIQVNNKLGQNTAVINCDQAIYDIVNGITKRYPEQYSNIVIRLGGFHLALNFLGTIGQLMKGSGIEDILVESGIGLSGTVNKVMSGKDYYKMVYYHSMIFEVMVILLFDAFENWLAVEEDFSFAAIQVILFEILQVYDQKNQQLIKSSLENLKLHLNDLQQKFLEFVEEAGITAKYWIMYIDMVCTLNAYIAAERAGDWIGHLQMVENMLPYIVATGHINYMSCIPIYLNDMKNLEEKHPQIFEAFMQGKFTVYQTDGSFNGVWPDLALEQTYNREGKTSLFKGITQNTAAREKYIKTAPVLTKVTDTLKSMVHIQGQKSGHHRETMSHSDKRMKTLEEMKEVICQKMVDPFTCENKEDLINIATGEKASSVEIITAYAKGKEAIENACNSQVDKIKPPKIQLPFNSQKSKKKCKKMDITKILQEESSVTRALCFLKGADDDTRNEAFSHEWTSYPSSLFEPSQDKENFIMRKGQKSDYLNALLAELEEDIVLNSLPVSNDPTVFVIDTMAFIQRYQNLGASSFKQLCEVYMHKILQITPKDCSIINIVGDRYDIEESLSLKNDERERRQSNNKSQEFVPAENLELPIWRDLMSNSKNKANILAYFSKMTCERSKVFIPQNTKVIFGGTFPDKGQTIVVTSTSQAMIPGLSCSDHEEADTRIIAHMVYCAETYHCSRIVIHANDTDIIIMALYHYAMRDSIKEIWIQKNQTYLPIHKLLQALEKKYQVDSKKIAVSLLFVYVLTGCDSVSYPYKRGKRKAAKLAMQIANQLKAIPRYDVQEDFEVSDDIRKESMTIFQNLYGHSNFSDLNTLRQHIFAASKSDLRSIPPTDDAFHFHLLRCLYQFLIFKRACHSSLNLPPPTSFGRVLSNGRLVPLMMSKHSKPPSIKQVSCKCKSSRCLKNCSCAKAEIDCFVGCSCLGQIEKCGRKTDTLQSDED